MAKARTVYFCTECGYELPKWMGKCPACGQWDTIKEHIEKPAAPGVVKHAKPGAQKIAKRLDNITTDSEIRFSTGVGELDRVLGGGAVAGSLVLVGGAPGIGKSTLLLQICSSLCRNMKVLYVSGEESEKQIKLRAQRIGVVEDTLYIFSETNLATYIILYIVD